MSRVFLSVLLACICLSLCTRQIEADADLDTVYTRFRASRFVSQSDLPEAEQNVASYISLLQPDCRWPDINYNDTSRAQ